MTTHPFIIATAGHVDHGKSALVQALTGTDPDRLPEEKARGITIDLGFAHLELDSPTLPGTRFDIGIIDVPGHEDFVTNMVAGVGSIDVALLLVAADDGWMPQTEEHLQILTYLGISRGVVALTKMDLCSRDEATMIALIREHLKQSPLAEAPIVPVSVVTQRGIEDLRSTLAQVLDQTRLSPDIGKPRLPVDRVFSLHGVGTVVTGTLHGGTLECGQTVIVQPAARLTRIRNIQTHQQNVERVAPGTRVALNLPDIVVGRWSNDGVVRGAIITLPELGNASDAVDVLLEKSHRLIEDDTPAARPLKDGAVVRVHHGSANLTARVLLFDSRPLVAGQSVLAQLRFDHPVFLFGGDRFIVRDWPEQTTLAGGMVLNPDASRHALRKASQHRLLECRAQSPDSPAEWIISALSRHHAVKRSGLLLKTRFSETQISEAVTRLLAERKTHEVGVWLVQPDWWFSLRDQATAAVQKEHQTFPEKPGLTLNELRQNFAGQPPAGELFEELLADLLRHGFVQIGAAVKHASHQPALPAALHSAGTQIRATLASHPFAPPSRKDLAPDLDAQKALRFLLETAEAVDLGQDVIMSTQSYQRASEMIRHHLKQHGPATASEIRQLLSTNRRVVIPLLEKLDRDGITVRQGDKRSLRHR